MKLPELSQEEYDSLMWQGGPIIYVAGPYSHKEARVRHDRYLAHERYVAKLVKAGHTAYSPIVHFHAMAERHNFPYSSTFWNNHLSSMLLACDKIHILQLPGWKDSVGLGFERSIAKVAGIEILEIQWSLYDPDSFPSA